MHNKEKEKSRNLKQLIINLLCMTTRTITFVVLLLVLCPTTLFSQNDENSQSKGANAKHMKGLKWLKNYLDESPAKG